MKYKIGQTLYQAQTNDNGSVSIETYIVRTIRAGNVYAINKILGWTWVKRSKKHFDWGWSDDIPPYLRESCKVGDKFFNLHTTKLASLRELWKRLHGKWHYLEPNELIRARRTVKRKIDSIKNANKKGPK